MFWLTLWWEQSAWTVTSSRRVKESSRSLESGLWLRVTMGLVSSSGEEESDLYVDYLHFATDVIS